MNRSTRHSGVRNAIQSFFLLTKRCGHANNYHIKKEIRMSRELTIASDLSISTGDRRILCPVMSKNETLYCTCDCAWFKKMDKEVFCGDNLIGAIVKGEAML